MGAQSAATQSLYAEAHYKDADLKLYPTLDEANSELANERVDVVIADKFPLLEWVNKTGKDCCKIIGDVDGTMDDAAIAVRKKDRVLRERFNKALDEIVADGTYKKISSKYFDFDIY